MAFDAAVAVSPSRPHFEFGVGPNASPATRRAQYKSGSGTAALVFAYTVEPGDSDTDGISIGDHTTTVKLDPGEWIRTVESEKNQSLVHTAPGIQSGHKIAGALPCHVSGQIPLGRTQLGQEMTLTVGDLGGSGWGFFYHNMSSTVVAGTLSPSSAGIYQFDGVAVYSGTAGAQLQSELVVILRGELTSEQKSMLSLHMCGRTYDFADAAYEYTRELHTYTWGDAGLAWSEGATRTLRLSTVSSPGEAWPEVIEQGTGVDFTGSAVRLKFDEPLDMEHPPAPGDFETRVNGEEVAFHRMHVHARSITLVGLERRILKTDEVTIAYTDPTADDDEKRRAGPRGQRLAGLRRSPAQPLAPDAGRRGSAPGR